MPDVFLPCLNKGDDDDDDDDDDDTPRRGGGGGLNHLEMELCVL